MDPLEIVKKVKAILEFDRNTIVGIITGCILGFSPVFLIWRYYWRLDLFQRCKQYRNERDELFQESLAMADELEREQSNNRKLQEDNCDLQAKLSQLAGEPPSPTREPLDISPPKSNERTPQEAESLPLVTNSQEIEENVKLFDNYLSGDSTERQFARQLLVYGKCFVVLRESERLCFAPSKFVGYTINSRAKYEAHLPELDGRKTNKAINSVLQYDCTVNEEANQEFRKYCERAGRTVSIGNHRRFWIIDSGKGTS